MNLRDIFALFTLCVIVNGAWWAAAVQPVILSLGAGAVLSAFDILDILGSIAKPTKESDKQESKKGKNKEHEDNFKVNDKWGKFMEDSMDKMKEYGDEYDRE